MKSVTFWLQKELNEHFVVWTHVNTFKVLTVFVWVCWFCREPESEKDVMVRMDYLFFFFLFLLYFLISLLSSFCVSPLGACTCLCVLLAGRGLRVHSFPANSHTWAASSKKRPGPVRPPRLCWSNIHLWGRNALTKPSTFCFCKIIFTLPVWLTCNYNPCCLLPVILKHWMLSLAFMLGRLPAFIALICLKRLFGQKDLDSPRWFFSSVQELLH